jgi:hypothetical protein
MDPTFSKMLIALFMLPVMIISGIYLRKKSRPYKQLPFTVHKVPAIIYIIFSLLVIIRFLNNYTPEGLMVCLIIFTLTLMLSSFVTGALQSFEKPPHVIIIITHKVGSYLLSICLPLTFLLIFIM